MEIKVGQRFKSKHLQSIIFEIASNIENKEISINTIGQNLDENGKLLPTWSIKFTSKWDYEYLKLGFENGLYYFINNE